MRKSGPKCYALWQLATCGPVGHGADATKLQFQTYRRAGRAVPTETPPPYFPQAALSPGDVKTARRMRLALYGCGFLLLLALAGAVWGVVYLFRSL